MTSILLKNNSYSYFEDNLIFLKHLLLKALSYFLWDRLT